MFLREIINELIKVRKIHLTSMYRKRINIFVRDNKIFKNGNIFYKKLYTLKEIAKILDVPTKFIIRLIQLERIEEIVKED